MDAMQTAWLPPEPTAPLKTRPPESTIWLPSS